MEVGWLLDENRFRVLVRCQGMMYAGFLLQEIEKLQPFKHASKNFSLCFLAIGAVVSQADLITSLSMLDTVPLTAHQPFKTRFDIFKFALDFRFG